MRMPNGYGSVYKKSGKRRKPYVARKTIGWNDKGQPQYLFIGNYYSKSEALTALARYNENPETFKNSSYTFKQVYEMWSETAFPKISKSNVNGYKASYKIAEPLWDIPLNEIKLDHVQDCVDNSGKNQPTLRKFRVLLSQVYNYAIGREYVSADRKAIVLQVNIDKGNPNKVKRVPFSHEEVDILLQHDTNEFYKIVLIMIYSGVRINELLSLESEDVHLDERYFYVDKYNKTETGIREVPIAQKIIPYIKYWLDKGSKYLICQEDLNKFTYDNFRDSYWDQLIPGHLPHDTRHTCITWLTEAKVDERWVQAIVGHKGNTVTERVYTHIDLPYKIEAIDTI